MSAPTVRERLDVEVIRRGDDLLGTARPLIAAAARYAEADATLDRNGDYREFNDSKLDLIHAALRSRVAAGVAATPGDPK